MKVLNTPSGKTLRTLVEDGVNIGISSRALGSVREENGKTFVENDLQLVCFDVVSEPSVQNAFLNLTETKNLFITTKADRLNRILNDICENL